MGIRKGRKEEGSHHKGTKDTKASEIILSNFVNFVPSC